MVLLSENALPGVDGRWKSSKHGGVKTIQGGVGVPQLLLLLLDTGRFSCSVTVFLRLAVIVDDVGGGDGNCFVT